MSKLFEEIKSKVEELKASFKGEIKPQAVTTPVLTEYAKTEDLMQSDGIITKILIDNEDTNVEYAIFEDIVDPGFGVPRHIHLEQEETFFFLEGTFDVEVDGQLFTVNPGDVANIPRGAVHAWKNVGGTMGRLRYIVTPGLDTAEMFKVVDKFNKSGEEATPEKMLKIAERFPVQQVVGPPL